jgi:hypothetical protein
LGLALDESTDGLELLESNGVKAYIDGGLHKYLSQSGSINIDYITTVEGPSGYKISVGEGGCGDCKCS